MSMENVYTRTVNNMSNKRNLRAVFSAVIAVLIAASTIVLSLSLSLLLGWFNEKLLESEMGNNSYATQSIGIMKEKIYEIVADGTGDTDGLDEILNEDELYTLFYNAQSQALAGKTVSNNDVEDFKARLIQFFDKKLSEVFVSDTLSNDIDATITEAVYVYENYMHPKFFVDFHKMKNDMDKELKTALVFSCIIIVLGAVLLKMMYHYKRHAFSYLAGGFAAGIIGNIFCMIFIFTAGWTDTSGIEPECYQSLAKSMTQFGRYVCMIVTGFEIVFLCFISYMIKKSKRK